LVFLGGDVVGYSWEGLLSRYAKTADLMVEIEMDCGGHSHGVDYLEVMVTCDDSEAVVTLAPSLET
jgi:hypothetical protein